MRNVVAAMVCSAALTGCGTDNAGSDPVRTGPEPQPGTAQARQQAADAERRAQRRYRAEQLRKAGLERLDRTGRYSFALTLALVDDGKDWVNEYVQPRRGLVEGLCAHLGALVDSETSRPRSAWSSAVSADDYVVVICRPPRGQTEKAWVNAARDRTGLVTQLLGR